MILASTDYKAQIEADIKPFEGLLLGLFFVTTGSQLDPQFILSVWPTVLILIFANIALKTGVLTAIGH